MRTTSATAPGAPTLRGLLVPEGLARQSRSRQQVVEQRCRLCDTRHMGVSCPKCGADNLPTVPACQECGAPLAAQQAKSVSKRRSGLTNASRIVLIAVACVLVGWCTGAGMGAARPGQGIIGIFR